MSKTVHQIIIGDARRMHEVADRSVQLVVTSPPYWQLKDYGCEAQIGFNDSYEDYINHLGLVWAECRRVLENGCRLCINIGDQFARAAYYGKYKVIPIKTEIIKCCEALGMDYMGAVIWQKVTTSNASGGGAVMGSYPYPRNGVVKIDYESILLFKKDGAPKRGAEDRRIKERSKMTAEEWNTYFSGHWQFPGVKQSGHIAMFPPELPIRLIKMFSFVGETVLDPFLGSGTTSLCAANLERNSVGYEINDAYLDVMRAKLRGRDMSNPAALAKFTHARHIPGEKELRASISNLPYIFHDRNPIHRKIDPKKSSFGSKIDGDGNGLARENFYYVRKIAGPGTLVLNDGTTVRLLGVKPLRNKISAAVSFLQEQTYGKKVFLKFDNAEHDANGEVPCYLYLSNKTFVNARLIKAGVAAADRDVVHRHLRRFIKYQENGHG